MGKIRAGLLAYPLEPPVVTVNQTDTTGRPSLAPAGAFIAELRGGGSTHRPISDPLATITATGRHHGLVIPYRRPVEARPTAQPLHTLSTRDSAGLLQTGPHQPAPVAGVMVAEDCYFRMVSPREQLTGQRFDPGYVVHGNQGEQTMQAGNAVSVNVAHWIGTRVAAALSGGDRGRLCLG